MIRENRGRLLTKHEFEVQVRSCAYGDLAIEDPSTTREAVDKAVDNLIALGELV